MSYIFFRTAIYHIAKILNLRMDYRNEARKVLERAKQELDSSDDHRLRYAALDLRMALESLIYERASLYKEELSGKKLSTWQPGKLLSLLLEVDPYVDKSGDLSFGLEEEYGKPAKMMKPLGRERVLSLGEIKKYYDRIGSYLHTPTLEQVAQGKGASTGVIRTRCNEVVDILEQVFSSPVFNVNLKVSTSIPCEKCNTKIVRRSPVDAAEPIIARCIECSASYILTLVGDKQVEWKPQVQDVECANPTCNCTIKIWESELKLGANWVCSDCGGNNQIVLGVAYNP
ncbi:MAG: hypothetical protein WAV82_04480 [Methylobacter sp.]